MKIGRRIYFEVATGNILVDTGERQGSVKQTTIEQNIASYKALSERNRDTFDVLELEYGQYSQDFSESSSYRVNVETRQLEFSYPDPNEPDIEQPYQAPLSEEVARLTQGEKMLNLKVEALSDQNEMLESVVQELIVMVIP